MEGTWTITELAGEAAAALAADPAAPADQVNGRVRDMPNERLIRWYTTIGLVDPPLARRGRTARYGRRHLLQLVAVKRRQAAGLTIAEIQTELAGAPDDTLRAIARLPGAVAETRTDPGARRDRFWAAAPTAAPAASPADASTGASAAGPDGTGPTGAAAAAPPVSSAANSGGSAAVPAAPGPAAPGPAAPGPAAPGPAVPGPAAPARAAAVRARPAEGDAAVPAAVVHGVRLAPGVTLLLDGGAPPGADDLAALAVAARPVLDELHRRGLAGPPVPADQPAHDTAPGSSP